MTIQNENEINSEEDTTLDVSDIPDVPDINELLQELNIPNKDHFKFVLRGGKTAFIPKEELEGIFFEDTFFGGLIRSSVNNSFSGDGDGDTFELWEDYDTFMSIIDSLRLNELIVYKGVNINYMRALCDKWCIHNDIIKKIDNNNDMIRGLKDIITTFECKNCKRGFSSTNNYDGACIYLDNNNDEIKGKHVVFDSHKESVSSILAKLPSAIVNRLIT
jgi:hypothetical protein